MGGRKEGEKGGEEGAVKDYSHIPHGRERLEQEIMERERERERV